MSLEQRRTKLVYSIIQDLVAGGQSEFQPGDVNSALRQQGQPLGTWEVRGEFSKLTAAGLIDLDSASGRWTLGKAKKRKAS